MLRLDWKNATEAAVGWEHGVTEADLAELGPAVRRARDRIVDRPNEWEGWRALPVSSALLQVGQAIGRLFG